MTYVRLDDKMPEHPKVARLSDRAFRIHIQGICYCQRNLSDGIVPKLVADPWGKRAVVELLGRGLWVDLSADDYEIHDFLEWNDSRESVLGKRGKDVERKRDSRRNPDGVPIDSASALVGVVSLEDEFEAFYALFPRHEKPRTAFTAFGRARKRASLEEILAGATRYRDDPNRDPGYTQHPATWLNGDGWLSDPLPPRSAGKARSVSNILALADHAEGSA